MASSSGYLGLGFSQGFFSGLSRALDFQIEQKTTELRLRQEMEMRQDFARFEQRLAHDQALWEQENLPGPGQRAYESETGRMRALQEFGQLPQQPSWWQQTLADLAQPWSEIQARLVEYRAKKEIDLELAPPEPSVADLVATPGTEEWSRVQSANFARQKFEAEQAAGPQGGRSSQDLNRAWESIYGQGWHADSAAGSSRRAQFAAGFLPGDLDPTRMTDADTARLEAGRFIGDLYDDLRDKGKVTVGGVEIGRREDETPLQAVERAWSEARGDAERAETNTIFASDKRNETRIARAANILGTLGKLDPVQVAVSMRRLEDLERMGSGPLRVQPAPGPAERVNDPNARLQPQQARGQKPPVSRRDSPATMEWEAPGSRLATPSRPVPGMALTGDPLATFDPAQASNGPNGLPTNIGVPESGDANENFEYRLDIVQWLLAHMDENPELIGQKELTFLELHENIWPNLITPAKERWAKRMQQIGGDRAYESIIGSLEGLGGLPTIPGTR